MSSEPKVLRPLSIPELFDEMFSLYRSNFLMFAGIVGIVSLPIAAITGFWLRQVADQSAFVSTSTTFEQVLPNLFLLLFFALLADAVAMAALTKAISERYLGHAATILGSYQFILARIFPYLLTILLVGIVVSVGFALLVVPGIIALFMFALVNPVFVVEGETFGSAMSRSRELAKENWFKILLIFILLFVLNWLTELASENLTDMILGAGTDSMQGIWLLIFLQTLFSMVVQPIGLIGFVLLYFDIRVRKEGYDLEMLASDMGGEAGAAPPEAL